MMPISVLKPPGLISDFSLGASPFLQMATVSVISALKICAKILVSIIYISLSFD